MLLVKFLTINYVISCTAFMLAGNRSMSLLMSIVAVLFLVAWWDDYHSRCVRYDCQREDALYDKLLKD